MTATTPRLGLTVYGHWRDAPWDAARWPSFSPRELACKGTGRLALHPPSLDKLQALRDHLGRPMIVVSAYRSPEHNASLAGAARQSWHMDAIAFDVAMTNHDPHLFAEAAEAHGFDGIGTYPRSGFIHIDTRGERARWGNAFPKDAAPFSAPEPQPRPERTATGVATAVGTGAGAVVIAREAAPTIEAVQGLGDVAQAVLVAGVVVIAAALVIWGPRGIQAALGRLRGSEGDL